MTQNIYWVRRCVFTIKKDEIIDLIKEHIDSTSTGCVAISIIEHPSNKSDNYRVTLDYLNDSDLDPAHPCYEQRPDWQDFADKAPCEAVNWNS